MIVRPLELISSSGSSVILMLERFMGQDVFRKGIVNYIKEYKYQNTTAAGLLPFQ